MRAAESRALDRTPHAARALHARSADGGFPLPDYSKEELVAELTSAFVSAEAGILEDVLAPAASYIHGWMSALKDDAKLIVHAAA
jgi:antirestriction protein ArdC